MHGRAEQPAEPSDVPPRERRRPAFRIAGLTIDPDARLLVGPDGSASLEPIVIELLLALVDAAGQVVTRRALFAHCWGNAAVGNDSLNRAIFALRQALRTTGGDLTIETIPRTGYRLIAPPEAAPPPPPPLPDTLPPDTAATTEPPAAPARFGRRTVIGGAVAGAAAAVLGVSLVRSDRQRSREAAALVERGDVIARDDMPDAALRGAGFYREALKITPDDPVVQGKLALALAAAADYAPAGAEAQAVADAAAAIRHALALDPAQPDARVADAILLPHFGAWLPVERKLRAVL